MVTNSNQANWNVTRVGGIATVLMVGACITGIVAAQSNPTSWIAAIINLPFGLSIYISLIVAVFTLIEAVSRVLGWPFFTKARNA